MLKSSTQQELNRVAAAGLIPIAIGVGFFVDYKMQARDLARFGLEVDAQNTPRS